MAWLLFGGTLIAAVFAGYQMVVSHTEETISLKSKVSVGERRIERLESLVETKNAYIQILERRALENASPDDIVGLLNGIFLHEEDSRDEDPAVPGDTGAGEA